jgi:hypothetical protein
MREDCPSSGLIRGFLVFFWVIGCLVYDCFWGASPDVVGVAAALSFGGGKGAAHSNRDVSGKVLVVFEFHWAVYHVQLLIIRNNYLPFFRAGFRFPIDYVVYGPVANREYDVLCHGLPPNGHYSAHTLSVAIQTFPGYRGYIQLNDDSFVNPYLLNFHDFTRVLIEPRTPMRSDHPWARMHATNSLGISNYHAAVNMMADICATPKYKGSAICFLNKNHTYVGRGDFFYIPREYSRPYVELEAYCIKHRVFLEMCVPAVTDLSRLSFAFRCRVPATTNMGDCVHAHPVKYSSIRVRKNVHSVFRAIRRAAQTGFYRKENLNKHFIWQENDNRPKLFVNDSYY